MYWMFMQKRIVKESERQATIMWGYDPKKQSRDKRKRTLVEKWQEDPLYNFPNDILYLDAKQVADKVAVTRRFHKQLAPEKHWNNERADACLGKYGTLARRCSMNDKLWALWKRAKKVGRPLTQGDIIKMIRIDIARSRLYPPGWREGDQVSPPQEYLDKLKEEGMLDRILQEIDEVTRS